MTPRPGRSASSRPVRPRYGRIVALLGSVSVTVVALLGMTGVLPVEDRAADRTTSPADPLAGDRTLALALSTEPFGVQAAQADPAASAAQAVPARIEPAGSTELPPRSGSGRRVVFDISAQRVWLVDRGNDVRRTYLVSGSLTDNLGPGRYEVYSTSRHAVGIDDSGTMQYMVRFAHGKNAAIGFHDIPVDEGRPVQTRAELGTPQSHGCIRQARPDARALWYFAIVGTTVVVTA